ncbi:MAG: pyridoxal phosphate-dependent aminotransferase [Myxococcota bacterium]
MKLSARSAWPSEPSPWAQAVQHARDANPELLDLTPSNPTQVGLVHPGPVYRALGDPGGAHYDPHPLGLPAARDAVAAYYARRGRVVDPARLWLCASTSEAYTQLLTLLADPGDTVLVPCPGYPLLDMLGDLAGVRRVSYPLRRDGRWSIDLDGLDRAIARSPRARVLVVIAPGNPTGAMLDPAQWHALRARARAHDLALLVDEVFADYPLDPPPDRLRFLGDDDAPCLVLSGLSKVAALPQLKLSWVVMHGPEAAVTPLRARAELAADALLSVATPVQRALPTLLLAAEPMQRRIRERLAENLGVLRTGVRGQPLDLLPADGGWTALLRLPVVHELDDLGWAQRLLRAGVLVQPGFLFDLPAPPQVAVSLLTPPCVLRWGIQRVVECVGAVIDAG